MIAVALIACFLIYVRSLPTVLIGVALLLLVAAALILVKDIPVIEFYNDACILYDLQHPGMARRVSYEDMKYWTVDANVHKVYFILKNEEILEQESYRYLKVYNILNKLLPAKKAKSKLQERREKKENRN